MRLKTADQFFHKKSKNFLKGKSNSISAKPQIPTTKIYFALGRRKTDIRTQYLFFYLPNKYIAMYKGGFFQKVLMHLSFPQTDEPYHFPELDF